MSTFRSPSSPRELVAGEFLLTADDFMTLSQAIHADSGIHMPETKAMLIYSRLARRLRSLGLESFKSYCELIVSEEGADERQKMLAALTTNVTRFFRERHHYDHLRNVVLPSLLARAKKGDCVRLWSAGCSNGQEAYSMALVILMLLPNAASLDMRILATDIDPTVIADGRNGVYPASALEYVPLEMRARFFGKSGDGFAVNDDMRKLVQFRELNLFAPWPMKKRYDVIFCRNVAIYFDREHQMQLWSRFATALQPSGYLYLGHSERLHGPAAESFVNDGVTTWRMKGARA